MTSRSSADNFDEEATVGGWDHPPLPARSGSVAECHGYLSSLSVALAHAQERWCAFLERWRGYGAVALFVWGCCRAFMWVQGWTRDESLYLVGVFFPLAAALWGMRCPGSQPPHQLVRQSSATMIVALTLLLSFMPYLFGGGKGSGWESCYQTIFERPVAVFASYAASSWMAGIIAAVCMLKDHPPSTWARRALWCIVLFWGLLMVRSCRSYWIICHQLSDHQPWGALLAGVEDALFMSTVMAVFFFMRQRLRTLEHETGLSLGSATVHRALCLGYVVAFLFLGASFLQSFRVCAALVGLGGLLSFGIGIRASLGFTQPLLALREEARRVEGVARQEALWASRVLVGELCAVAATCLSTAITFVWTATYVWRIQQVGPSYSVPHHLSDSVVHGVDGLCNVFALAILSGLCKRQQQPKPLTDELSSRSTSSSSVDCDSSLEEPSCWQQKVEELAHRGFYLEHLLDFCEELLGPSTPMPGFDPLRSTTCDVVREAVIPLSRHEDGSGGVALATRWNHGEELRAESMVTHTWSNVFMHLVAALVADAVGEQASGSYDNFILALTEGRYQELKGMLRPTGALGRVYWVCAFCINQHASICGSPRHFNSVTGAPYPLCTCAEPKFLNDMPEACEVNKFDAMMAFLRRTQPNFTHVVAMDMSFELLSRAWCIAEIAEAEKSSIPQNVVMHSERSLIREYHSLKRFDIQKCESSRPEDKEHILGKIADIAAFNEHVQAIVFGEHGLLNRWMDGRRRLQTVGRVAARVMYSPEVDTSSDASSV
mmetsp:Transcript_91912/g.231082  ORF Transcript_91912/g.231082 Transcript_91912/m.231082 type:complete len:775 (-) Transcript_91912:52-2376(-)